MTQDADFMGDVMHTLEAKRNLEAQLSDARKAWVDAVIAARDSGITVSAISRATGVVAPNLFRLLADAKKG
jgi:hypothetical protein